MHRIAHAVVIHERIAAADECEDEAGVESGAELSDGGGLVEKSGLIYAWHNSTSKSI